MITPSSTMLCNQQEITKKAKILRSRVKVARDGRRYQAEAALVFSHQKQAGESVQVESLSGYRLDVAVAKYIFGANTTRPGYECVRYSERWEFAMPILDRAGICIRPIRVDGHPMNGKYLAMSARTMSDATNPIWGNEVSRLPGQKRPPKVCWKGDTYLEAGLRCLLATEVGSIVVL